MEVPFKDRNNIHLNIPGSSCSKPINFYFFTAKGGFVSKLWPNKVINYKYLFLNLVKNPPLTVNK